MVFSCRREHHFHVCMFKIAFSPAGHWKPTGVNNHWGNNNKETNHMWRPLPGEKPLGKPKLNKPSVETNGGQKPLGNQKNKKKQNVETNGGQKPLGNPKKTKKTKCGDLWGSKTIGKSKKNKKNKMWRPMGVKNHWEI